MNIYLYSSYTISSKIAVYASYMRFYKTTLKTTQRADERDRIKPFSSGPSNSWISAPKSAYKYLLKKTKKNEKKNGFKVDFLPSFGPIVEYTI